MINYGMTTLMIKLKRACNYHRMLMRMYQNKIGINYLRTVNVGTLLAFEFLSSNFDEYKLF